MIRKKHVCFVFDDVFFLFNIIVSYIILKLKPPRTQNFLKNKNILRGS